MPGTQGRRPAATRQLTVKLAGFAGTAVETMAERQGLTPQELVGLAAEYYLADENAGRQAAQLPRWLDELEDGRRRILHVDLSSDTLNALLERADRERTSVEWLIEHATLFLIADLDSGRVQARVAGDDFAL
jgi:hypothetical protein